MLSVLLAIGCAGDFEPHQLGGEQSSSIHGGAAASPSAWPNVVALDESCSGVLIAADVVVFAAHCGPFVATVRGNGQEIAPRRCVVYPKGMPGGTDLAYCVLERGFSGGELIAPALGCEVNAIAEGTAITLIGYGRGADEDPFGTLRVATSQVTAVSGEIAVESAAVGTCEGDSGGPAFVEVPDSGGSSWRLAGVLSTAETAACRAGPSYYTPLWPLVAWLEAETGIDVSPCGTPDGTWKPTSACVATSRSMQEPRPVVYSATCGSPFDETRSAEPEPPPGSCHVVHARGTHMPWLPGLVVGLLALARIVFRRD